MARRTTAVMAVLFMVPMLAGCFGGPAGQPEATSGDPYLARGILPPELRENLTEPVYGILGHFDHTFRGTTGIQLYVDYVRPDVPEGVTTPVILVFTPYQASRPSEAHPALGVVVSDPPYRPDLVNYFVPRGYTVAFADVRGNHHAGGCIDQTGPEQWQDGYDYVEWLGTQPWSSGRVGMWGVSYDGETQLTTAILAPPHLITIVPIASVSNQYDWNFYEGVPYEGQPARGMVGYLAGSLSPSFRPADVLHYHEKLECQGEALSAGVDFSGDNTTFWKERDYRPHADKIEASVLYVHGLADWNVRPVNIDPMFNDIQSVKRGVFGQWTHQSPTREDWQGLLHAWYDHWLMERENGILDILPPVLIQDSQGAWWGHEAFPARQAPTMVLELSADGRLVAPGNATEGRATIHDYPKEAFQSLGAGSALVSDAQQTVFGHPTSVAFEFTTDQELRLYGRPTVTFTATSSATSTHWAVRLHVVGDEQCPLPDGRTQSVCLNTGYQDTRHRAGLDQPPSDLRPGEPYELSIRMYPQYDVIPAGATVRLILRNDDGHVQQDPTNSVNTIHLGGEAPALLHLPLDPGGVPLPEKELPLVYPGYLE